jgi:hypothetical protein
MSEPYCRIQRRGRFFYRVYYYNSIGRKTDWWDCFTLAWAKSKVRRTLAKQVKKEKRNVNTFVFDSRENAR